MEPKTELDEWYFLFFFEAAVTELQSYGQGATFKEISNFSLSNVTVLLPPINEQIAISNFYKKNSNSTQNSKDL